MVDSKSILAHGASLQNAATILKEIDWLSTIMHARIQTYLGKPCGCQSSLDAAPPAIEADPSVYAEFVRFYKLNRHERLLLILALLPHIAPQLLGNLVKKSSEDTDMSVETALIKTNHFSGLLPSGETALFLLAGNDIALRFACQQLFHADHVFHQHHIISIATAASSDPLFSGQLTLNDEYVDLLTIGKLRPPQFSMDFPAKRVQTTMEWSDLVLDSYTLQQLNEIKIWLQHGQQMMNGLGLSKRLKPGYKALFYGPPGTGKTLTAGLLGKSAGIDVYRVDLSTVVSKYIGETEKNLEKIFQKAEHKNWILFFDEADALFGKRTSVGDAHDKYANQEIAYLLQRLEEYNGLVILSSNMRHNIDEAFSRRLQSIVQFPVPREAERLKLWQSSFSQQTAFGEEVDLERIAERFELAGGSIISVVQYATLMALDRGEQIIRRTDIWEGIRKEYVKEGKTI
jgi:hypothetical protein